MYATNPYKPYYLETERALESVMRATRFLKRSLFTALVLLVFFTIGFPFFLFFGYWLKRKRTRLVKTMLESKSVNLNSTKDYVEFKNGLQRFDGYLPILRKAADLNPKKIPRLFRYTPIQLQKLSSTLVTFNTWLHSRLTPMNQPRHSSEATEFKFVSEKELWENRNHAYQYWM